MLCYAMNSLHPHRMEKPHEAHARPTARLKGVCFAVWSPYARRAPEARPLSEMRRAITKARMKTPKAPDGFHSRMGGT